MAGEKILVVDDDLGLLKLMKIRLQAVGYRVTVSGEGDEALTRAQEEAYDLAIVDLKMAGMDGMTLMEHLLSLHPHLPVIILTAHGTIASAVEATKKGAYDYLTKPFAPKDLLHRLEKALEMRRLKGEVEQLRTFVQDHYHFDKVITASDKMQQVLPRLRKLRRPRPRWRSMARAAPARN